MSPLMSPSLMMYVLPKNKQIAIFFPLCLSHICSNELAACITVRWWRVASGSCPRNHGAEAAAPIQQPMITGDSGATDAFTQCRTVRLSCWILPEGFKPIGLLLGHGNSIIFFGGDVSFTQTCRATCSLAGDLWRERERRKKKSWNCESYRNRG